MSDYPDFVIALDLDGVCYDFESTARYMLRQHITRRGDPVPPGLHERSVVWDQMKQIVPPGDWKWLWTEGIEEGLFRYGHVVSGAIEGARELSRLGDVLIVTSRPKQAVHDTIVWLGTMFDKVTLSGLVIQSYGQKKSEVWPFPGVYVDDATHNADDILDNTASHVVLFDTPWNQDYPDRHPRVHRAQGWDEVVRIVNDLRWEDHMRNEAS